MYIRGHIKVLYVDVSVLLRVTTVSLRNNIYNLQYKVIVMLRVVVGTRKS